MTEPDQAGSYLGKLVDRGSTPGLQYLAVDADGPILECSAGRADVGRGERMTPRHTLMAYSMSKTITAAAVLQLVEDDALDLDLPIARYLAPAPYGGVITVRQLLAHTSGAPNPIPLRWVHRAAQHASFDEKTALADVLRRHPRLASVPGARYAYSNIGYWLLGQIVECVAGEPFASRVDARVLRPLGLGPCDLGYSVADPALHASGYLAKYSVMNLAKLFLIDRVLIGEYEERWLSIRSHYVNGAAFGGLVGSARGFGCFLQDQLAPRSRLFRGPGRALFYGPERLTDGRAVGMTLGWHIGGSARRRYLYKEGGGGGFHSLMRLYPEEGVGTVLMANTTSLAVHRVLDDVDAPLLERRPRRGTPVARQPTGAQEDAQGS